jgi:predicted O-methyltransferase YrrM
MGRREEDLLHLIRVARGLARDAIHRPIDFEDEYVEWLLLVNAGMQRRGNIHLFDLAIRTAPEAPFLEIGSFAGLSANITQHLKRKHGRREPLFTCDKWIFEGADELPADAPVSAEELRAYVRKSFERSVRLFNGADLPFTIEATSDEFFVAWREGARVEDVFGRLAELGGPLGFCFIDGNHQEEFVQRDFEHCDEQLLPGGLILFDDSTPEAIGDASTVVRRVARDSRYEVVARNPNWLLRKTR